jgi:hypothetical protein
MWENMMDGWDEVVDGWRCLLQNLREVRENWMVFCGEMRYVATSNKESMLVLCLGEV